MTKVEAKKYLIEKKLFKNPILTLIGKGNNYKVYLIEEENKQFVLRVPRADIIAQNKLKDEFLALKFLEEQKINFVQKPIFFDKNQTVSLLSYIPGKHIGLAELSEKDLDLFVFQMFKLHSISYKKYLTFCKKNKIRPQQPETPLQAIKKYGVKKLNFLKKYNFDQNIIGWIEPKLKTNLTLVKKDKINLKNIIFGHWDLSSTNIIKNKKGLFLIDFEQARFIYSPEFGLTFIFIHELAGNEKQLNKILPLYAKYGKIKEPTLRQNIQNKLKVIKVNDIIWAAKKTLETKQKQKKDWQKYKQMTYNRIREYEQMFEK